MYSTFKYRRIKEHFAIVVLLLLFTSPLFSQQNPDTAPHIVTQVAPELGPTESGLSAISSHSFLLVTRSARELGPANGVLSALSSHSLDDSDMAATLEEALLFNKYPTYEQYDSMMHYFAESYSEICRIDTFGTTDEGRLLLALKVSDNVGSHEDEPAFLYTATMHGDELIGYILTLRLIAFILENYGENIEVDRLVNDLEIWINPLSNPDYTFYGSNSTVAQSTRPYIDALNLNRLFPDPEKGDPNDTTGVILENQAMMLFMDKNEFNLSANIHSGAEVVNYPWDYTYSLHPDDDWYRLISREYADLAHDVEPNYMNEFTDGITNGAEWYVINGGRQDYVNYYLHGREVTLELSNAKKVPSEQLETYWEYNQWSLLNYMSQARYGIHGVVKDSRDNRALAAKIWVLNHDDSTSWVVSDPGSGNFYRYLKEGVYDLEVSAEGYFTDTIEAVSVTDFEKTELEILLLSTDTSSSGNTSSGGKLGVPEGEQSVLLYPNPANDLVHIVFQEDLTSNTKIELYSFTGSLLKRSILKAGQQEHEMNLDGLEPGVYHLMIFGNSTLLALKLIVR